MLRSISGIFFSINDRLSDYLPFQVPQKEEKNALDIFVQHHQQQQHHPYQQ
jgi:hypothetical protein